MRLQLWWAGTWVTGLLFSGWWLGALGGAGREQARAAAFAQRAGLSAVTPGLVRAGVRRQRFVLAGVALGCAATYVVDYSIMPIYAGLALGAVADAVTRPGPPPGTPRVAHATGTRLRDYVPGWLLGVAVAAVGGVVALAGLRTRAPLEPRYLAAGLPAGGPWAVRLVLVAVAGLAVSLALARLVVGRRQPAGSPDELAVDDALRAQAVRDVLQVTAAVSFVAGWLLALSLTDVSLADWVRRLGGRLPVGLLAAVVLVGLVHELAHGPAYWRTRLHRDPVGAA